MKKNFLMIAILSAGAVFVMAQPPRPPQPTVTTVTEAPDLSRRSAEISDSGLFQTRGDRKNEWESTFRPRSPFDISKAAREMVKVSKDEKLLFDKIADANDLNLLKVFAAPLCAENRLVLNAGDEKCAAAADLLRVSFYSFLKGYYGETISDFRILEDNLVAGNGGYIHGFLVDLGTIDVGTINKNSAEVTALQSYPAATTGSEETRQRGELRKGFNYQNLEISSNRKMRAGHVYLMRLIAYRSKNDYANIYHKDAVYVLKVGAVNPDGTALILWRRLLQKDAPRLKDE